MKIIVINLLILKNKIIYLGKVFNPDLKLIFKNKLNLPNNKNQKKISNKDLLLKNKKMNLVLLII